MVNQQNTRYWISFVSDRSQVIICREKGPFFLQISTNVSIIFLLFCETAVVCYVFLWNFAREIGARNQNWSRMPNVWLLCYCSALLNWVYMTDYLMDAVQTQDYYLVNWTSNCYFRLINCNIFANPGTYIKSFMFSIQTAWSYLVWYWPNTSGVGQQALSMHNSHNPMKQ